MSQEQVADAPLGDFGVLCVQLDRNVDRRRSALIELVHVGGHVRMLLWRECLEALREGEDVGNDARVQKAETAARDLDIIGAQNRIREHDDVLVPVVQLSQMRDAHGLRARKSQSGIGKQRSLSEPTPT